MEKLDIMNCSVVFEVGCGRGRMATQIFQSYPHIKYVLGVEKSDFRFGLCEEAASKLHLSFLEKRPGESEAEGPMIVRKTPERLLATTPMARTLEFRKGDIADLVHVTQAMNPAIVLFNVCHNPELLLHFKSFFQALKSGTRIVTYENLFTLWRDGIEENPPFEAINIGDRFFTTWERNEGHDFYMWRKL
mmetsp:Transcript_32326/g.54791  ORF Transcript_32326/g.54791 Transcript_32326/m.54791 type:complete len:190 (-) Transcript_32326:253-822(-)